MDFQEMKETKVDSMEIKEKKETRFDRPSSIYNFPFHVEGRIFWTPGELLACHSPVLRAMIYGEWKEGAEKRAELPGPNADDFLEFLLCIVPTPVVKTVTHENVDRMLQLSREWEVMSLQQRCEEFYSHSLSTVKHSHQKVLDILIMASKSQLRTLLKQAIARCIYIPLEQIKKRYDDIPPEVLAAIYLAMIKKFKLQRPEHKIQDIFEVRPCYGCGVDAETGCETCQETVCEKCRKEQCVGDPPCLLHCPTPICQECNSAWFTELDDILVKI